MVTAGQHGHAELSTPALLEAQTGVSGRLNYWPSRLLVQPKRGEGEGAAGISTAGHSFLSPPAGSHWEASVPTPSNTLQLPRPRECGGTHQGSAGSDASPQEGCTAFLSSRIALGATCCKCRNTYPLIARDPWKIPGCGRPWGRLALEQTRHGRSPGFQGQRATWARWLLRTRISQLVSPLHTLPSPILLFFCISFPLPH